jgi:hypothetical protein
MVPEAFGVDDKGEAFENISTSSFDTGGTPTQPFPLADTFAGSWDDSFLQAIPYTQPALTASPHFDVSSTDGAGTERSSCSTRSISNPIDYTFSDTSTDLLLTSLGRSLSPSPVATTNPADNSYQQSTHPPTAAKQLIPRVSHSHTCPHCPYLALDGLRLQ